MVTLKRKKESIPHPEVLSCSCTYFFPNLISQVRSPPPKKKKKKERKKKNMIRTILIRSLLYVCSVLLICPNSTYAPKQKVKNTSD